MKRFANHPEPWGEFVDVKQWGVIKNPQKYAGKEFFIGAVTDPYMPEEKTYRKTLTFLEQMQGVNIKITIQTKSDLVLRDLDLIKTFPGARVGFSINTLDEAFRNDMDKAIRIERRLTAMQKFHRAGVRTTCFISPIFPGITDISSLLTAQKTYAISFGWKISIYGEAINRLFWHISDKSIPHYFLYMRKYISAAAGHIGNFSTVKCEIIQKPVDSIMCVMTTDWKSRSTLRR